jgi:hypothetical protein
MHIEYWPIARLKPYERNPRKNDQALDGKKAKLEKLKREARV